MLTIANVHESRVYSGVRLCGFTTNKKYIGTWNLQKYVKHYAQGYVPIRKEFENCILFANVVVIKSFCATHQKMLRNKFKLPPI